MLSDTCVFNVAIERVPLWLHAPEFPGLDIGAGTEYPKNVGALL
jgi:hypothetical protein